MSTHNQEGSNQPDQSETAQAIALNKAAEEAVMRKFADKSLDPEIIRVFEAQKQTVVIKEPDTKIQAISGFILIALGVAGLLFSSIAETIHALNFTNNGSIPAAALFSCLLGIAFVFPDMLQGAAGYSTMRISVFMVISIFLVLVTKIGWTTLSFDEFRLDTTWVYILGLAFGGKVIQKFGEEKDTGAAGATGGAGTGANSGTGGTGGA